MATALISRRSFTAGSLVAASAAVLAACGSSKKKGGDSLPKGITEKDGTYTIKIGCSPVPHGDILEFVQSNLAKKENLNLEIKQIDDYQTPNSSLADGSLAANFYQTPNFLELQEKEKGYKFESLAKVHVEPMGLYSNKHKKLADLPSGAKVVLNSDPANTARGLKLLQTAKLITLDPKVDLPTDTDVTSNPKNLKFTLVEGAQTARNLDDADLVVLNGNYALAAKKNPAKDALLLESGTNSPYANLLVVREEDKDNEQLKKLAKLLNSPEVKKFIQEKWTDSSVIPAF
ncbi:MAG: MetQ/NlpA family ABC transporter substrate-binding protein [Actinomyces graevenitzii]|nr:MetQ/NlpA family ABC transporter substrate-binding protein [Actinomyces graevenitzii]